MLWEFSQIRETYGWEVANLAKAIDARVSIGFMDMQDELGEEMYNMYHLHVSSNKLNITRDSIVAQLGLHFDMRNYCTHDFDCCGCWSRKRMEVANPHSREGVSYWIIDKWHKNI
jgi:hypothetical protein|tara:strand:- start:3419 stop:3763 length:345 start_codon:yes stop_codon:yes gene_type:complete